MIEDTTLTSLGNIEVYTTNEGGHPVEFWAKRCIERIVAVSDDAPDQVKNQVNEFKDNIEKVIEQYMQNAIKSDRITINNQLEKADLKEAADLIRKL
jgi:adenylate kinase family enzyme